MQAAKELEKPSTLTINEVLPFYVDEELAQVAPALRLYRIDSTGQRYYYTMTPEGQPTFYLSVTSFTSSIMPTSSHLIDWRVRLGKEESEEAARIAASYGTFLHVLIAEFMRTGSYNHEETFLSLNDYMKFEGIPGRFFGPWLEDLETDMLAFAQFVYDRNVKPLAIEFPLCSKIGLAGMVDLVCEMDWNRTRIVAIADFKSGRKGFWESHEAQLHTYKMMWNDLFKGTGYEVSHVFNWAPKAWRKEPTYDLTNQSESIQAQKLPHYLNLFQLENKRNPSKKLTRITDVLQFGENPAGAYSVMDMTDYITSQFIPHAQR